jgi:hypothetical protein
MRRIGLGLVAIVLCGAGLAWAASSIVVTNSQPAASASMQLVSSDGQGCFVWNVTGKVKPSLRGFGSVVQLRCERFFPTGSADVLTFPNGGTCDGPCYASVDGCGNFAFDFSVCGLGQQLDNSYYCTFVAHVDAASSKACGSAPPPDAAPKDPNGTAPCAGGFCPDGP